MKRFALAGNPNSGKTTLFNTLTGSTAHVGNWPGVTVDKKEGLYRKFKEAIYILDLPGIYSLSPYSPEEVISREVILHQKPDCVINVVDATNLERNLYLTTQLMEIDVPIIIALNMIDAVNKSGDIIDEKDLEKRIGLPVVSVSALKEQNIDLLMQKAYELSEKPREATSVLAESRLGKVIDRTTREYEVKDIEYPLFHAVKILEGDDIETKEHPGLDESLRVYKQTYKDEIFGPDFEAIIADERYKYISENLSVVKTKKHKNEIKQGKIAVTSSEKADRVLTHKWFGIPIFLIILFAMFHFTFSEDLFYLNAFGVFGADGLVSFRGNSVFEGLFANGGINSLGVILFNLVDIGSSQIISLVNGWLTGSPVWVTGFITDGVLGGLFAILSFIPQIMCLFLFFSILEDSGYMARVAFILDRMFRKLGLSGRAVMPMIMGFGCSVPATINTRTLADQKERTATIRVIPFFSCGAKLPILTAVAGAIVMQFGIGSADVITYGMYLLGMLTAVVAVLFMRNTSLRGETPPFIMELPNYHLPQFKSLMIHLWDKLKHFVIKAFTVILASTVIIWLVSHFSWTFAFLEDVNIDRSILAGISKIIEPLFTPMGFGSQLLGNYSWVFVVAAITGLIAKENVIATFGTLAATVGILPPEAGEGIGEVMAMIQATGITVPGLIAFIAFNMTTVPCFAAVATARAELPKGQFKWTLLFWLATSYLVGTMIFLIGTYWWTVFVFAILFAVTAIVISRNNKRLDRKELARGTD